MARIEGRYVEIDGVTISIDSQGRLRQAPGSGGGSGGLGTHIYELIPLTLILGQGYVDLLYPVISPTGVSAFIQTADGDRSVPQAPVKDFSIVRRQIGGDVSRFVWDSTFLPNSGNGSPIPDNDLAPTVGMTDSLITSDALAIYYYTA